MKRHRRQPARLRMTEAGLVAIAAELVEDHAGLFTRGWALMRGSQLWRVPAGTLTARIVYQRGDCTVVHVLRGIQVDGREVAS